MVQCHMHRQAQMSPACCCSQLVVGVHNRQTIVWVTVPPFVHHQLTVNSIKVDQESMDHDEAETMSQEAKNDSSLQVILQILFIGLIGMLPTCLRYFQTIGMLLDLYEMTS